MSSELTILLTIPPFPLPRFSSDRSHPSLFRRRSSHLYLTRTLTLPDALLGFQDSFQHMDGRNVSLVRTGVTQTGWVGTIQGEGMPIRGSAGKKGNLYVEYELVLPERVEGDMLKGESFREDVTTACFTADTITTSFPTLFHPCLPCIQSWKRPLAGKLSRPALQPVERTLMRSSERSEA